jgi:hypothetical protein
VIERRVGAERERSGHGPRLIAGRIGVAHSTVHAILRRHGLSRIPKAPREQVVRFEWPCPGDLLQMDTRRLARFTRPGHRVTGDRQRTGAEKRARERPRWSTIDSASVLLARLASTGARPARERRGGRVGWIVVLQRAGSGVEASRTAERVGERDRPESRAAW